MRKVLVGSFTAVVVVVAAVILVPSISAQTRERGMPHGAFMPQSVAGEIGVSVRELSSEDVSRAKLEPRGGVWVESVREGSPAARAGLRSGDIIVEFDGERVRGVRQFSRLVLETPPGHTVKGSVVRDGMRQTIDVTPEAAERLSTLLPEIGREVERRMRGLPHDLDIDVPRPLGASRARLGLTLIPLTDQLASHFGVKEGMLVSAIEPGSPAARADIRAGDVITAVNGRNLGTPADVAASIHETPPGSTVEIRLVRNKKEMAVKATVPDRPALSRDRIPV